MQIFVRHSFGDSVPQDRVTTLEEGGMRQERVACLQDVSPTDTVETLMAMLSGHVCHPLPKTARLMHRGRYLSDGKRSLREYSVAEASILQINTCSLKGGMMIKVKTLTGKEIEIDIEPSDTVERIKERVEEKEGIPPVQQRLIFAGKQMNDDKMAKEYHVEGGSVLHLVLALRGGTR